MKLSRDAFLELSAEITGYSPFELEGTGLIDTYHDLLPRILGPALTEELAELISRILLSPASTPAREEAVAKHIAPPSIFWPVISALLSLWYLGTWNQLPDTWYASVQRPVPLPGEPGSTGTPAILAYTEQLSYRTAFAHSPGANPTGFGSWSDPPVETIDPRATVPLPSTATTSPSTS